jgi:hypothetical protein
MSVAPGTKLGAYEIVGPLGAGGMGEVYRARDTKLGREVALKLLPQSFTHDSERVARFRREAQVLASLNHPHIAAIYGVDEASHPDAAINADVIQFLVLELVDGETLAHRIGRGALPLDEALALAKQVAEALEAAHEKGIIHRDLKPANIALTHDGEAKVLDFGLAKAMDPVASSELSMSPTLTFGATQAGVILGTAAYMSPEQAKGRVADKRSDVWSFGCVLFEMLAGRRAFEGEDVSDTLATVLKGDPDWTALPSNTPRTIRALIEGCLKKDRRHRIGDVSTAMFLLNNLETAGLPATVAGPPVGGRPPVWQWAMLTLAASLVASVVAAVVIWRVKPEASRPIARFIFSLPQGQQLTDANRQPIAISPDGTQLLYAANGALYVRSIADFAARLIPGTDGLVPTLDPAFSPDGRSIVFWTRTDSTIKRIAVSGGAAVTICPTLGVAPYDIRWTDEGILFTQPGQGILRVSPDGGQPDVLVALKGPDEAVAQGPDMLPDHDTLIFSIAKGVGVDRWDKAEIVAQSLKSGRRKTLIRGGNDGRYVPTGHIVYALGGTLFAVPFDLGRLEIKGGPVPVVEGVRRPATASGSAYFAFSNTGALVYVPGPLSGSSGPPTDSAWRFSRIGTAIARSSGSRLTAGPLSV